MAEVNIPNAHDTRVASKQRPKVDKVVTGKVTKRKNFPGRRFIKAIFEGIDDSQSIGDYIMTNIVIPQVRDVIYSIGMNTWYSIVYRGGNNRPYMPVGRPVSPYTGPTYKYASVLSQAPTRAPEPNVTHNAPWDRYDFRDIILDSRDEAEYVLDRLMDYISEYGDVSVSVLYDMVGIDSDFTDNRYGWKVLQRPQAGVYPSAGGGYYIDLPRPFLLD